MSEDKPRIDGIGLAGGVNPAAISSASSSGICNGENGVNDWSPTYRLKKQRVMIMEKSEVVSAR